MGIDVKLDMQAIKALEEAAVKSAETAMELVASNIMDTVPIDQGDLQNNIYVDIKKSDDETHVFIDHNCVYARYLYFGNKMVDSETGKGPALIEDVGYRFRKGAKLKVKQPIEKLKFQNGRTDHWFDPYISGDKSDFVQKAFTAEFKKKAGV
nr:MAG TPA: Minor capsid protein [Caudoviricetes sp.]